MNNILSNRIRVGMEVHTLDGEHLGRVEDVNSGTFEVAGGVLLKREYAFSFDEILRIDSSGVVLTVSAKELEAMRAHGGLGTTFGERAAGLADRARRAITDVIHPAHTPSRD